MSNWVIDATTATFERDVIERSKDVAVVIDFWAPWCAPCRELGPILEKLAEEYSGRFVLAKVDVDASPELASAFNVRSIPYVVAIRDRHPVNQLVGLLPEADLRLWIEDVLPGPAEQRLSEGEALEQGDPAGALAKYREAAGLDPHNDAIKIHLARVLLAQKQSAEARELIAELEKRGFLEPEAEQIKSQLDLESAAQEVGDVATLRQAVERTPNDPSLRLKLAEALAGANQHAEALELCLELVRQDKGDLGNEAKEISLKILNLLGTESTLAREYRRKLASALY